MLREADRTLVVAPAEARRRAPSPRVLRARQIAIELALMGLIAALVPLRHAWPAQAALLILLLTLPGAILLRALRVPGDAVLGSPVYVPAASIVVVLAAGLGVDLVGPQLGAHAPLRTWPLLAGTEALLLLLAVLAAPAPLESGVPWRMIQPRLQRAWPLVLPLAAAAGALRLTQGHSPAIATAALAASGAALLLAVVLAERISRNQLSLVLYGAGLAACWGFSLRGHYTYGFDIASEYHVVTASWSSGVWHPAHAGDAYGAMLSLTVLPSALHALTGIGSLALLKAVYPALLALLPPALFGIAERFLRRRFAFIAAGLLVVQSYFFQQMPAIARQEIALLLFIALVAAVLDDRLPRRSQLPLVALLGAGMAVSHYSTTYMALAMFGVAAILQLVLVALRRPVTAKLAVAIAFVATAAAAAGWYAPVTHSSANLTGFSTNLRERGLDILPNAQPGQNPLAAYLSGNSQKRVSAEAYARLVAREYRQQRKYVVPLRAASNPRYRLQDSTSPIDRTRNPTASAASREAQLAGSQLLNLLAVIGALALLVRRRTGPLLRQLALLALATLLVLGFVRLSGTAASSYNQERAFVQTMVPLGVAMAWLVEWLAARRRGLQLLAPALTVLALAATFFGTSGLRAAAFGGGTPTNLANGGEDYERFYVTAPELAAARWVAGAPHGSMVYTDRYGQLRVLEATGRSQGVLLDVTPLTLDHHAWVYASRTNIDAGRARGEVKQKFAIYRWPARFLDENFNTVYSNGSSTVYHK